MILRILDRALGMTPATTLIETEASTLRQVITARVRHEVEAFNRNRPDIYHGLVAPDEAERLLNGYDLKRVRELDAEVEIDRTLRAFEKHAFVVFANGEQLTSLDEGLKTEELEFIKLVPLAGG
jgi:hypothetical protein